MATTINQHGEKVEVIGSVRGLHGREEVTLTTWKTESGRQYITVRGRHFARDYVSRAAAIKKVKFVYSDPSNEAQWSV